MPAYLRTPISKFLTNSPSEILGELVKANAQQPERFALSADAILAWEAQLPQLRDGLRFLAEQDVSAGDWEILLEYPIPQVGKRIDAVLLAHNSIIVIETKTGKVPNGARRQVEDYAISLACFHEGSAGRCVTPVVLSDVATTQVSESSEFAGLIRQCVITNSSSFGPKLKQICQETINKNTNAIQPDLWDSARFNPIPPIIDAAVKLYAGMDVFEIGHAAAARQDLQKTTDAVIQIVEQSKNRGEKAICFVTGVPGAGKTLVGLNAVHHTRLKDVAMFLSGNGPLVKIIREALIRDVTKRQKSTRRSAEVKVQAFIANVHRFADEYASNSGLQPVKNVVVFDEAQRAWDREQNARPSRSGKGIQRPDVSEPHMLLEIMNRRPDWAVIVALIGGGQEINRGEAGLAEWGESLNCFPEWKIYVSPEIANGTKNTENFSLFRQPPNVPERVHRSAGLHLSVNNRSIRAQGISDWVDAVLLGDQARAAGIALHISEMPVITRDLLNAKRWLTSKRVGRSRSGLVASASASRLRADGLEPSFDFHKFYEWEHWFLDDPECDHVSCDGQFCGDVRASSKLEVHATQFEIQGLELDWVGLCWGEDLMFCQGEWRSQRFNNKKWILIKPETLPNKSKKTAEIRHRYRINGYRVLLTRARQGMVIYVPEPNHSDNSRSHTLLKSTYEFLIGCGAKTL